MLALLVLDCNRILKLVGASWRGGQAFGDIEELALLDKLRQLLGLCRWQLLRIDFGGDEHAGYATRALEDYLHKAL